MSFSMKAIVGLLVVMILLGVAWTKWNDFSYPKPQNMPGAVAAKTEDLLAQLQLVLETKAPFVVKELQPGLSMEQIAALELDGGFRLSDDLKALYRWHNGVNSKMFIGIVPGKFFIPLDELVRVHKSRQGDLRKITLLQAVFVYIFGAHRFGWLEVMGDGAGDGYFFDPARKEAEGAFFYNFSESGYYKWFPSFKNFLAGTIECYERGFFTLSADGTDLEEKFDLTGEVWQRYAEQRNTLSE